MEQEHQFIDYIEQSIIKNWDKDGKIVRSPPLINRKT